MKILLNGYFHENLGDDLFFHLITTRYPEHTFYMPVHADHVKAYTGRNNVKLLRQTKLLRGMNKLLTAVSPKLNFSALASRFTDISVLIGGSMFQELSTDGSSLKHLSHMPRHPKGQYVIGINFGPYKTQTYLNACRNYLVAAKDVCFRDAVSYKHFSDLPNTRLGSDIVFGIEKLCPATAEKENTCVISIMDFSGRDSLAPYAEAYYRFLLNAALQQQKLGRKILLVSFCRWEGDERAIEHFLRQCPPELRPSISTLCYDGQNWQEICQCICSASCLIASRFHSMILGLVYGVPTTPISYSNKTTQLLSDLGCENFAITPDKLGNISIQDITPITGIDISNCKAGAERHFFQLDALLK